MLHTSYGAALIWTALVYQLMTSSNAQATGPGYLGCFEDGRLLNGGRNLRGDSTTSDSLSVEWCFNYCGSRSNKYAGVEYTRECYCGNNEDYGRRGTAADSECRNICPGNSNQYCGDTWRIAIYQISQGVCNNVIGPPAHGSHEVTNPTHVSYSLANYKFFGTCVRFECDPGHVIQGEDSIECTRSGNTAEWSNSVPTCTAASPPTTTQTNNTPMAMTTVSHTVTSVVPTTTNQTNNMVVTASSGGPSSNPGDTTDGREIPNNPQASKTGTIIGTSVGVISALVILPVVVIILFRRRDNKRNASSDVAMAEVTSTINQTQRDSDVVSTEPNQASTIPVYSQVIKNRTKNENVYANPDDVTNLAAESAYEVNLDIQPSSNEDENETGLVDNILYDSSALKDESEMRNNDLNDEHVGALTTMEEQPGWVENIIYE
ncbi:uncharacterized protein LOC117304667 isoform X2 [Asterias rubens]|uniref:uncharacterized protein LOC117304667 isoform X2 n=1 Tax=Asterias rubens TaxID=7604 RepID=UPI001455C6B3|nr:uncharacterized protein LOC117304667 isoform X2 [Asterias rubens]